MLKAVITMTPDSVVEVGRQAIETLLLVSAPMLGLSLVVGLLVSIMQTMTQVNEATLTFVPKILAVFLGILLFLPWMMSVLISFMTGIWMSIPQLGR